MGGRPLFARGFILPLTLWMVALTGFAVMVLEGWAQRAIANSQALAQRTETALAVANIENEIIFAVATRPMSTRGLEVGADLHAPDPLDFDAIVAGAFDSSRYVTFDHRSYVLDSNPAYAVALQDGRGLVNLNFATASVLGRLFAPYGVSAETTHALADTLADWIDEDDFTRLAGAEAPEYKRRGMRPPSNAFLLTPMEARNVMGWNEVRDVWRDDLHAPLFTTCAVAGFNPNTAPARALEAYVPGLTKDRIQRIIARRSRAPFISPPDFAATAGVMSPDTLGVSLAPANCYIVDVQRRSTGERVRFALSLLPFGQGRPWQIDYRLPLPREPGTRGGIAPDRFPAPESLLRPASARDALP